MHLRILVLSLAAAAPVLPLPVGIPLLLLAVLAAVRDRGGAASGRRLAILALLLAAGTCLSVAAVRGWRLSAGQVLQSRPLAARYAELWRELREPAVDLHASLPSLTDAAPGELFSRLRTAISGSGTELTALLFDAGGRPVAWSGSGLLHEAADGTLAEPGPAWRLGMTAATLLWVEELPATDGTWRLITGRSLATERLPARLTPGGELPIAWTLMRQGEKPPRQDLISIEAEGFPTLVAEQPTGEALSAARRSREGPWRRRAVALVAVALVFTCGLHRGPRRLLPPQIGLLAAASFAASWACGAAWPAALALASAVTVLLAVTRHAWGIEDRPIGGAGASATFSLDALESSGSDGWRRWLPTSTLTAVRVAALIAAYPLLSPESPQVTEIAWAGSLAVAAAAALHWIGSRVHRRRRTAFIAVAVVALAIGGGFVLADWARLAALTVTVAAGGVWLGSWALGRDWGRMLGAVVLAAAGGGVLYTLAAGWGAGPSVDRLPVPTESELRREVRELDRRLGSVTLPAWRTPDDEHGRLQDLALSLWRHSPLARRGVLSALTVERGGRAISSFAFGLPMTEGDRLDTNPNRWQELQLPGWNETLIQGEGELIGVGDDARIHYWALLRPGFRIGEPLTPDLATGLVRGPPDAGRSAATPRGTAGVTESPSLRSRTGTAPLRAIAPPLARQELGRSLGLMAGVLVAAVGATAFLLLFALPARRIRRLLRGAWSSYSHRLVGVFALLVLATLIPLQSVLVGMVSRRMDAEQLQRGMAALESTQRVLGEYVDSLPAGFGIQTILDDELLSWLARVIHHEVNLYWDSSVYASSRRELFTAGLLPARIPGEIYADLALTDAPVSVRRNRVGETSYLEIYARLRVPGMPSQEKLFLSIPLLAQQEAVTAEVEALRRRTLLAAGALFLILLAVGTALARSFAEPLREMAEGTRRIAVGAEGLDLEPGFRELATLANAIDDMAHRIGEGRRRLLSEKQLVDRVVDSVNSAVVSLDGQGRVLLCNRVARELLGVEPGGDLRQALSGRSGLQPVLDAVEAAPPATRAHTVRLPSDEEGEEREWAIIVTPLPDGEEPSTLLVVEDVTEVLRGQRLQAWAEMARIIAHEIKNPLTPIRLSAEHLRQVHQTQPGEVGRILERCTDNILRQVEELRTIAGEFATFSQIPRLERRESDLTALVAEMVSAYEPGSSTSPSVRLTGAPPPHRLHVDPRLIGRVLRNLLENALRAAGADGRVEVRIESDDEAVSVIVADGGPGVPTEMLSRIFDPYFSTREGGTGLGLSISRRIAEEHHGSLAVRNHSHLGGLEVELRLPREPAAEATGGELD